MSATTLAWGQTLEGANLPDSEILARFGGNTSKPGDIPDIVGIYNTNNLTQGDIRLMTPYFEWVLQTPLSVGEKNELRRRLIAEWTRPDSDLPRLISARSAWGWIKSAAATDAAQFSDPSKSDDTRRLASQANIVAKLRAQPNNDDAKWILARYAAARRPLAAGTPALTQPIADMFADSTIFALNEVAGRKIASNSPEFRAALARRLASQWPKMSVAERRGIAGLPARWPAFKKFYWPNASESGREESRVIWGRQLAPSFPSIRAVAARRGKVWDKIQTQKRAAWARLSPAQQEQMISSAIAQNAANTQSTIAAMSQMQMIQHATNMNIINNSRSSSGPISYYYVR